MGSRIAWILLFAASACGGRAIRYDDGSAGSGSAGKGSIGGAAPGSGGAFASGGFKASGGTSSGGAPVATGGAGGAGGWGGSAGASFRRGMNLGNRLDAPNEGDWGTVLRASDFVHIASRGFDHIRLPVRFNAHAELDWPYELDETFMQRVDWAIEQALGNGLSIVVDFHHYEEIHVDPLGHRERFLGIWSQIAQRYATQPPSVAFELLNEPSGALDARWNDFAETAIVTIREWNPTRLLIVDGPSWAAPSSLFQLSVPADPNLVVSVHAYDPVLFTLQGAEFGGAAFATTGVVYPGPPATPLEPAPQAVAEGWPAGWFQNYNTLQGDANPSSPAQVAREIGLAASYTAQTGIPAYNGEWGCIEIADFDSRLRWMRDVRRESERQGLFGWAIWDDGGGISLFNSETGEWNEALLATLFDPP